MLGLHVFCLSTSEKGKYCPNPFFQMPTKNWSVKLSAVLQNISPARRVKDPQHPMCPRKIKYDPAAAPWSGILSDRWLLCEGQSFSLPLVLLVWESHSAPTKRTLNTSKHFERFMLKFAKEIIWLFPRELMQCLVKKPFDISTEDYLHTTLGLIISNQYLSLKISFPNFLGFRLSW